ncbi:MAG TPA: histidine kinase [Gammaproteobacteria bacterium]|nr:histidine kinase [Gammaproteobacteria bacterium]
MSLLLRLSAVVFGILLLSVAIGAYNLVANVRRAVSDEMSSSLELTTMLLQLQVDGVAGGQPASIAEWRERLGGLRYSRHLRLSLAAPGTPASPSPAMPERVAGVPQWFVRMVAPRAHELVRAIPLGGDSQVIVRAEPADEILEAWRETRLALALLGGFGLVATALVLAVLRRALAPLALLSNALQRFEAGDYDVRLQPSGVPDIDRATESFNHMAGVLSASRSEMTRLAQEALAIREEERRHLAQELHDGLGQSISAIKALAVSIERKARGEGGIGASAAMIANVSTGMYDQVRSMMARLRPSILDELGLVSALANMIDDWNAHHEDVFCSFEHLGAAPTLSADGAINVFRIVQEALTNVARHAQATSVSVRLRTDRRACLLDIEDDGRGFDPATVRRGHGLLGIDERVRAMGGSLSLATAPGRGTKFAITIPLSEHPEHERPVDEAENSAG